MAYDGFSSKRIYGVESAIPVARPSALAEVVADLDEDATIRVIAAGRRAVMHYWPRPIFDVSLAEDVAEIASHLNGATTLGVNRSVCIAVTALETVAAASKTMGHELWMACGECALSSKCEFVKTEPTQNSND